MAIKITEDVFLNNKSYLHIFKEMVIEVHSHFGIELVKIVNELEKFGFKNT